MLMLVFLATRRGMCSRNSVAFFFKDQSPLKQQPEQRREGTSDKIPHTHTHTGNLTYLFSLLGLATAHIVTPVHQAKCIASAIT